MRNSRIIRSMGLAALFVVCHAATAQITPNAYMSVADQTKGIVHEIKIDAAYFIHSMYKENPAEFISTVGGFYAINDGVIEIDLEFNSNFEKDSIRQLNYNYELDGNGLILYANGKISLKPSKTTTQELDGNWLFGTRGPDKGQERRGDSRARKTLKYLQNGRFQWIAYNVETMKFSGTGGGSFSSNEGVYQENIEYFSRDNSRVGAQLQFNYELKGNDWHHKGNNSRGEPMYEIWEKRK